MSRGTASMAVTRLVATRNGNSVGNTTLNHKSSPSPAPLKERDGCRRSPARKSRERSFKGIVFMGGRLGFIPILYQKAPALRPGEGSCHRVGYPYAAGRISGQDADAVTG